MALKMLSQTVNGKTASSATIDSDAITALSGILEGHVSIYDLKQTGGTVSVYPVELNTKTVSCGMKSGQMYKNCSFKLPHVKPTKGINDISALVVNVFHANFADATTQKAQYCNLVNDGKKSA